MRKTIQKLLQSITAGCLVAVAATAQTPPDVDLSFDPGSGASGTVETITVQPDGKILIGGFFTRYNGVSRNHLARLNANGSLDLSFNPAQGADTVVYTITVQPDGKILIGGDFTKYNGVVRNHIARLNADGSLDRSFDPGSGTDYSVSAIVVQRDGKILIGGFFTQYDGVPRRGVARLNVDGSPDLLFNPGPGHTGRKMAIQNDGKIVVADGNLSRLNTDGSADPAFHPGSGVDGSIYTLCLQQDGKIIIGGIFSHYDGILRKNLARVATDGSLDLSFDPGAGFNQIVYASAIQTDGKLIFGGNFSQYNGVTRFYLARINTNGSLDLSFNQGAGANATVHAVALQSDGKILIGGGFTYYNEVYRVYIARIFASVPAPTTWYRDWDGDGFGDPANSKQSATQPPGYVANKLDCNDYRIYYEDYDHDGWGSTTKVPCPDAFNNQDCNDNDPFIHSPRTYYRDADGDGYGDAGSPLQVCFSGPVFGYVKNSIDCNDNDPKVYWPKTYYRDADGDGFGDPNNKLNVCSSTPPAGYVTNIKDPNDTDPNLPRLSVSTTTAKKMGKAIPEAFSLTAYPNPFSQTSSIRYSVPVDAQTSIKIYSLLGREIGVVFCGKRDAGSYGTEYNMRMFAPGIYYCRMVAIAKGEIFTETEKLVKIN